jgi:hypothetical protein
MTFSIDDHILYLCQKDVALAAHVYQAAQDLGIGMLLPR